MLRRRVVLLCALAALFGAGYRPWGASACSGPACEAAPAAVYASEPVTVAGLGLHGLPGLSLSPGAPRLKIPTPGAALNTPTPTPTPSPPPTAADASRPSPAAERSASAAASSHVDLAAQPGGVPTALPSLLADHQLVVLYGMPGNPDLGVLGTYSPEDAARAARRRASELDAANGASGASGMLDLVYAQAQAEPTDNGLYLRYLPDAVVRRYLDLADRYDLQIMLDLQIGRGDPLGEVTKIARYLRNPRVHVAIDPEYSVGPNGIPLETAGIITADQLNAVQAYLSNLAAAYHLPSKVLVIHQYLEDTVQGVQNVRTSANVDLVVNMDAFGAIDEKARKYAMFSHGWSGTRHGFNVFLHLDDRVMGYDELLRLSPRPDVLFYQ